LSRGAVKAEAQLGASSRKLSKDLKTAEKKWDKFGKNVKGRLKKSFGGLGRSMMTLTGIGAGFGLYQAGKQVLDFERKLTRLGIQSRKTGQSAADVAKQMDRLRDQIRATSDETGISSDEILDGATSYVSLTGDIAGATTAMETFSKVAVASGSSMNDIAVTAASIGDNLAIDPSDFEKAFSILLSQGKMGAVELKEFATLMASLSAQFPAFGKTGLRGLADLGAGMQVMRKGFGTSKEAATGFMGLMRAIIGNAKKFEAVGVKVFDIDEEGIQRFRSLAEIFADPAMKKLIGNKTLLKEVIGRAEGMQALEMADRYSASMGDLVEKGLKSKAVMEDYAAFSKSASGRMAKSWERMKNTIARAFTPQRIEAFASGMERVAEAVGWMADNLNVVLPLLAAAKLSPGLASLIGFSGGPSAAKMTASGAIFGAAAAAALGYGIGSLLESQFNLSGKLTGTADTTPRASNRQALGTRAHEKMRKGEDLTHEERIAAGTTLPGMSAEGEERRAKRLETGAEMEFAKNKLELHSSGSITIDKLGFVKLANYETAAARRSE